MLFDIQNIDSENMLSFADRFLPFIKDKRENGFTPKSYLECLSGCLPENAIINYS